MAVGDAAAAFDPIASQGLANALGSSLVAAGAVLSGAFAAESGQRGYSDLILAAFLRSEAERREVYRASRREASGTSLAAPTA